MKKVELITLGLWHFSVGDFARYEATSIKLAEAGICVMPVSVPTGHYPVIVDLGNLSWSWMPGFLKPIITNNERRQPIGLNAIALPDESAENAMVKHCSYLSFRDQWSASVAQAYTDAQINLTPCPSMFITPFCDDLLRGLPQFKNMKSSYIEYAPKTYVVIDAHNDLKRLSKKVKKVVPIDSRPWERRDWKGSGRVYPLTHSAQIMMSIISNAEVVVTCSLHIGILALAAGTPFVVYDVNNNPQQYPIVKSVRYWERAGFPEVIYHGKEPLEYAQSLKGKMLQIRQNEFEKAEFHIESLVRFLALSGG